MKRSLIAAGALTAGLAWLIGYGSWESRADEGTTKETTMTDQKPTTRPSEQASTQPATQPTTQPKAPQVVLETSMGRIVLELNEEKAPITAKNFLRYVEEGHFGGTIFHRVIPDFMIQGGGFTPRMEQKRVHKPIKNEAANGLKNLRGTIAMARTADPDSATAQFFVNVANNDFLNYRGARNPGYAVFGKVVEGMDVVDKIVAVRTTRVGPHENVPAEPVVIEKAEKK